MRCYCCNKPTDNLKKDRDGKLIAVCKQCQSSIYGLINIYQDVTANEKHLLDTEFSEVELENDYE